MPFRVQIDEDGLRDDKGIKVIRALHRGQAEPFYYGHPLDEVHLVNRLF